MIQSQKIILCAHIGPFRILIHFVLEQLGALALNQRELLSSMLGQIGVAFPKGAPFITVLHLLRVIEFHCDFIDG
jgi:hypothetical protein